MKLRVEEVLFCTEPTEPKGMLNGHIVSSDLVNCVRTFNKKFICHSMGKHGNEVYLDDLCKVNKAKCATSLCRIIKFDEVI